ncbi:M20/M25/M40 family metallo-hydrolase [Catellatospora sichuanensis]|uniref:M20/M25/M40 family metallo-hydrolase n=1 Tax=Catellatospora sichuanensis TaxID=1969805 RepID=UPI0011840E4D|nr:M20/M25/M40 family metallo-hydrolase [Catellatospora sichuanensis]
MTEVIDAAALRKHIGRLTAFGPRHRDDSRAVSAALDHITGCLAGYGYEVVREPYGDAPHEVNLLAERAGTAMAPVLEIGAHWDSVAGSPGADDNASGVAGLLELARICAAEPAAPRTVRFCFFGGEEHDPGPCNGSRAHVARLDATRADVEGIIVLEMIGYRDLRPGSQTFPDADGQADLDLTRLHRADFIAAVGNVEAAAYLAAIGDGGAAQVPPLPVVAVPLPSDHEANGARSDHQPYWASGRLGVMVTDTAEFRNPHYHQPTDTLDTLDLDFAAQVTQAVADAMRTLAHRPAE